MNYKIDIQDFLPVNKIGSENNAATSLTFETETEASNRFRILTQNLLKINDWSVNAGKNPTEFFIYNKNFQEKQLLAEEGNLVKIKIPAPENKLGEGFDWVIVRKIEVINQTDLEALLLQMKPHQCPENADKGIAHFYTDDATSTFVLAKKNKTIQFSIHGRNEIPNTEKVGFINSLRNFFVASGGIFGGSKLQWQNFSEEFVKN